MAVIGCDIPVRQVVGAEQLAETTTGIWTKTHFYEKDGFLHARTFLVAGGSPAVLEFRVSLKPLMQVAARIHQRLHDEMAKKTGEPVVGFSFSKAFKSIKNTAKKIGKSKLIKSVGKAIKTVAKSKIVGALATGLSIAVPVVGLPALAAYGTAHAAIKAIDKGKKVAHVATQAKAAISKAQSVAPKLDAAKAQAASRAKAAADAATARAKSQAQQIAAKAKAAAARVPAAALQVKAQAAAQARATLAAGKTAATNAAKQVVAQVQAAEKKVAPALAAATTIQSKLAQPAVKAKLLQIKAQADSAKKTLSDIKDKAQHGTPAEKLDAQKSAAIVNLVAKNQARIQAMSQQNAGGLPSILIDKKGRLVRGKFRVVAASGGKNPDVLYQGPKAKTQSGTFQTVSGLPGIGAAVRPSDLSTWWTLEVKPTRAKSWVSQAKNGVMWRTHAEAAKALQWYIAKQIPARVARVRSETIGTSPFPPLPPREQQAKRAEYESWLKKHAPRRSSHIGWSESPAWATTVAGDDDPEVIGAAWSRSPQAGSQLYAGDKVKFFVDGKSFNGRVAQNSHLAGHLVIHATRQSGGRIHTSVPRNNVYAIDLKDRARRKDFNYPVGWSSPPSWSSPPASPPGSIGCDCEGSQF